MQALSLAAAEGSSGSAFREKRSSKQQDVNTGTTDSTNRQSSIFCYLYNNDETVADMKKSWVSVRSFMHAAHVPSMDSLTIIELHLTAGSD